MTGTDLVPYQEKPRIIFNFTIGSSAILPGRILLDEKGRFIGQGNIIEERDEHGRLTRRENLPPYVTIGYDEICDDKKWWEFWK